MTMAAFKMFSGDKGNTDVDVQLRLRLLRFSIGTAQRITFEDSQNEEILI